jgi:hypothetical protein
VRPPYFCLSLTHKAEFPILRPLTHLVDAHEKQQWNLNMNLNKLRSLWPWLCLGP